MFNYSELTYNSASLWILCPMGGEIIKPRGWGGVALMVRLCDLHEYS